MARRGQIAAGACALAAMLAVPGTPAGAQGSPFRIERLSGPQLLAFEGARELGSTAARLGMLTQVLDFSLEIGPDGKPTGCALGRKFRSASVERQLCDILMRRSRFAPSVDSTGQPTTGTYRGRIDFRSFIAPDR